MAELADAPDLGSGVHDVQVQVLLSALHFLNPNPVPVGRGFGFLVYGDGCNNFGHIMLMIRKDKTIA